MSDHDDDNRSIGQTNNLLVQNEPREIRWIWEGVLAERAVTLLSAAEKIGKTTLLSLLLDRRRAGGQLLGRAVYPGKTILCSEEDLLLWRVRQPPLGFGPNLTFHSPRGVVPTRGRWRRFIDDLLELTLPDILFDLLVIDTAVRFMPLFDRNKRTLRWALGQLRLIADVPASVLVLNQSRNMHRPLAAFADIVIDMAVPRSCALASSFGRGVGGECATRPNSPLSSSGREVGGEGIRRRIFTGVGRYPGILQSASAELNPDGTDYTLSPETPAPHPPLLATLQSLLSESATPLTRQELLTRWPGTAPRQDTLWRTLTRGVETGLFVRSGSGTKIDAFRYGVRQEAEAGDVAGGEQQDRSAQTA
jgi:hypothetical protein